MTSRKNRIWHRYFTFYGLNAFIGFSLGVFLVFITLHVTGQGEILKREIGKWEILQGETIIVENIPESEASTPNVESLQVDEDVKDVNLTFLLVGVDNRPEEKFTSNTDSLIVTSIDPKSKKVVFLSVPRDTQVIMQNGSKQKINALARLGQGIGTTERYIEGLIGHSIDGYIITNFQGFKNIIDSLGGITLTVEKDMFHDTADEQDRYINLKKGDQRLNGTEALQYARFRSDELADISRTQRQQKVMKAIVTEATSPRNLPKIPLLIPQISSVVETDLSRGQLWSLAKEIPKIKNYEMINQTLPGSFSDEEGISYWKVEKKEVNHIITNLFRGNKPPVFKHSTETEPVKSVQKQDVIQKNNLNTQINKEKSIKYNQDSTYNKSLDKENNQDHGNSKEEVEVKNKNNKARADKDKEERNNESENQIIFEILES